MKRWGVLCLLVVAATLTACSNCGCGCPPPCMPVYRPPCQPCVQRVTLDPMAQYDGRFSTNAVRD